MKLERVFLMMLIEKLSLEQVEYKPFNEVCEYIRGITYNKSQEAKEENEKNWKVLRANNIDLQRKVLDLRDVKEVDSSVKVKESQRLRKNDILICAGSGSKEHIGKVAFITEDMDYTFGGFMAVIRVISEKINSRFLFHILAGNLFSEFLAKKLNVSTINNLNSALIKNFQIPLPPLPIQQEIVRILDTFTNFTAELTDKLNAELTARRKQYEYYRDELLKTGEQVSLYEVAQYSKDRILASELTDENYVGVDNLLPNKQGKIKSEHTPIEGKFTGFVKGDILVGNIRPYLKKIWFSDCVGGTNGDVLTIRVIDKERVLPRFLYFALSTESFFNYDMNNAKGAKMPRGDKKAVMNYQFYLPSLEIQEKVVSILETFDNLCNGFEYGLPAEIYARQQQYEYYRDELLNFKELHNKED